MIFVAYATNIDAGPRLVALTWRNLPAQPLMTKPPTAEEEDLNLSKLIFMNPPGGLAQLMKEEGLGCGQGCRWNKDDISKLNLFLDLHLAQFF